MILHNLGFDVEYIIKDKNGKSRIIDHSEPIKIEGKVGFSDIDNNGDIVASHEQPMRSFVLKSIDAMFNTFATWNNYCPYISGGSDFSYGMICGSGTNAVSISDTALQAKIEHSATNGIYYLDGVYDQTPTINGSNIEIKFSREFRNDTAGSVNISECGIATYADSKLLARDVFTSGISLQSGYRRKITYTFSIPTSTSKSWLYNFAKIFDCSLGLKTVTMYDTSNTSRSFTRTSGYFGVNTFADSANSIINGIQVGTGTDSVVWDTDYKLQTQIAHGAGAGQLQYSACADTPHYVAPYTSGSSRIVEYWRDFTNSSGSAITVNECGFVFNPQSPSANIMLARWLTGGITVNNGEILTVKFKVKVTA